MKRDSSKWPESNSSKAFWASLRSERFGAIIPCGLEDVEMVSMSSVLQRDVEFEEVAGRVAEGLAKAFP